MHRLRRTPQRPRHAALGVLLTLVFSMTMLADVVNSLRHLGSNHTGDQHHFFAELTQVHEPPSAAHEMKHSIESDGVRAVAPCDDVGHTHIDTGIGCPPFGNEPVVGCVDLRETRGDPRNQSTLSPVIRDRDRPPQWTPTTERVS